MSASRKEIKSNSTPNHVWRERRCLLLAHPWKDEYVSQNEIHLGFALPRKQNMAGTDGDGWHFFSNIYKVAGGNLLKSVSSLKKKTFAIIAAPASCKSRDFILVPPEMKRKEPLATQEINSKTKPNCISSKILMRFV